MTTAAVIKKKFEHICVACKTAFQYNCLLKYHIRKNHFNRIGLIPHSETRNVNQVWYEKDSNTNVLIEMRKISENVLLIQKLNDDTTIKPTELKHEELDVRKLYPIYNSKQRKTVACRVCQKMFGVRLLSKHFATSHANHVKKKCESCGSRFKRLINCARHICPKHDFNKKLKKKNDEWSIVDS